MQNLIRENKINKKYFLKYVLRDEQGLVKRTRQEYDLCKSLCVQGLRDWPF